jgi:hypothetical protein
MIQPEIPQLDITSFSEQTEFLMTLQIIVNELVIAENARRGFGPRAEPEKKAPLILMP